MAAEGVKAAVRSFFQAAKKGGVGIVGASSNRDKFGNKVRIFVGGGVAESITCTCFDLGLPILTLVACVSVVSLCQVLRAYLKVRTQHVVLATYRSC